MGLAGSAVATIVAVVPTDADAEQVSGDVRFFLAALDGLSDAAVNQAVLPFPSHEVDLYRGLAPHPGVLAARARAHDPAVALARGWSVTRGPDGRAVRSVDQIGPGDDLRTTLADGTVHSTVVGTHPPATGDRVVDPNPQEHA